MNKVNFAIGIHNHQPVGNFDFVFEDAYQKAYLPFWELLEKHPKIRLAQHYSGILFNWLKEHKPEFIPRLKKLVDAGQIEMMTGGFYEPIMSVIPYRDKIGQIKKLTDFIKTETGYDAEIAFPLDAFRPALERRGPGKLQFVRFNIAIIDKDKSGQKPLQLYWRPEWESPEDYPWSGVFKLN